MPALLKDFPSEIRRAVLQKQLEIKITKKEYKSSQAQALIEIVKEWMDLKKIKQTA
jgi:hypothetical protein